MKNSKSIKILCAMVVMVLLTTCVIGTTLARYVTSDSASDTARVAKWGIELQVGGTLFGSDYAAHSTNSDSDSIIAAGTSQSVSAIDGANIVAPGTKNDTGFGFSIKGTPEVAYNVTAKTENNEDIYLKAGTYGVMVEVTGLNAASKVTGYYTENAGTYTKIEAVDAKWVSGTTYYELHDACTIGENYYPLTWAVAANNIGDTSAVVTKNVATIAGQLADLVSENVDDVAKKASDANFNLTWAWAFDGNDAADTILGNLIAGMGNVVVLDGTNYYAITVETANNVAKYNGNIVANLEVTFNFEVTAEQVD